MFPKCQEKYRKKINAELKKLNAPPITSSMDKNIADVSEYGPCQPHYAAQKILLWRTKRDAHGRPI